MSPEQKRKALELIQMQAKARGLPGAQPKGLDQRIAGTLRRVTDWTGGVQNRFMEGASAGLLGDEFRAGLGAAASPKTYDQALADERASEADFRAAHPVAATIAQVAGAIMGPGRVAAPVTGIKGAAAASGVSSAIEGFAEGEGGFDNRIDEAKLSGAIGFVSGGLTAALFKGANSALRSAFKRAEERPTLEALRTAKNVAYSEVRRSGIKFSGDDMSSLSRRLERLAKTARWDVDQEFDEGAVRALRMFERRADKPITLNNLDKMRQRLWDVYKRTDEPFVLQAIGEIDGMIEKASAGNEVLQAARAANSKFAKAELLENAFRKAELQTASTGSGGNILNKYRQAVTRIITNPNEARWFSGDELKVMEAFVRGDGVENTLRRIGKLAPGGNGLMTALNVYAASVDPSMLAVTAAGTAAKGAADRSAMRGSEAILDAVSTGVVKPPAPPIPTGQSGIAGGAFANDLRR